MPLPVTVEFHDDETRESLCDRLSVANGFTSLKQFMSLTGISAPALAAATPDAIDRLAHWSEQSSSLLANYRIGRSSRRLDWRLGHAAFNKQARRGRRFRYCPECVIDDVTQGSGRPISRPYIRLAWLSRSITNCVRHTFPIVETSVPPRTGGSFCRFVAENMSTIERQAADQVPSSFLAIDAFAADSIQGIRREPFLDQFETHVVIDLCTHLGQFMKRRLNDLPLAPMCLALAPVREIGFHLARQGESAIRTAITQVIDNERPEGSKKFFFGSLGRWLRSNSREPAFAKLLELFQDIAVRNLPFGEGDMCFTTVQQRYVHTVVSASIEYGLNEPRIIQLLQNAGLINNAALSNGRIYFDAERARPILEEATRTLTSREARETLGVSEEVMTTILKRGLLQVVESREGIRGYTRIRREDLDAFQWRVFGHVTIGAIGKEMVTITRVCPRAACETWEVLSALIEGRLKTVEAPADHGGKISALRFNLDEAVSYFFKGRKTPSNVAGTHVLSQRAASGYMKVKPTTIPYLINLGLLDTVEIRNPVNGRMQRAVLVESLDEFMVEHIAISAVAAEYETHPIVILAILAKIGVRPIYDNCGNVSRFFRRADVGNVQIEVPQRNRA